MRLLACVEVPALPLQLLLRQHPGWADQAVAVVDEDKPQGLILWSNKAARAAGVLPGLRYGSALALVQTLRASPVSAEAITTTAQELLERLRDFSPDIEPAASEPGIFWLDAHGFSPLYGSSEAWARQLREMLLSAGYTAGVVVGFRRFGTYAVARALLGGKVLVFDTPEAEDEAMRHVLLERVGLPPGARDALAKLGIHRVGQFLGLPAHGLARRFGPEAQRLHRFASGEVDLPLAPTPAPPHDEERLAFDYRETNAERLGFMLKPLVDKLLFVASLRGQALIELRLVLFQEDLPAREELIRTAAPTLSSVTVMELVQLRLGATPFPAPVVGLSLTMQSVAATREQLELFAEKPRRDPAAASRAFARLRAAFGRENAVVKAVLRDRHTPESSFAWEPLLALPPPHPLPKTAPMLVRHLYAKPLQLTPNQRQDRDGWLLCGPAAGPVEARSGPYRLTGSWWTQPLERDYFFVQLHRGGLLQVYCDLHTGRWFLQGEVT